MRKGGTYPSTEWRKSTPPKVPLWNLSDMLFQGGFKSVYARTCHNGIDGLSMKLDLGTGTAVREDLIVTQLTQDELAVVAVRTEVL